MVPGSWGGMVWCHRVSSSAWNGAGANNVSAQKGLGRYRNRLEGAPPPPTVRGGRIASKVTSCVGVCNNKASPYLQAVARITTQQKEVQCPQLHGNAGRYNAAGYRCVEFGEMEHNKVGMCGNQPRKKGNG